MKNKAHKLVNGNTSYLKLVTKIFLSIKKSYITFGGTKRKLLVHLHKQKGLLHKSVSNLSRKVIVCTVLPFLPFGIPELL